MTNKPTAREILEQQIAEIRAKCVEANPDGSHVIYACEGCQRVYDGPRSVCHSRACGQEVTERHRAIRLADVLLAMGKPVKYMTTSGLIGTIHKDVVRVLSLWEFRTDDLTKQSPETIAFIHSLLCV